MQIRCKITTAEDRDYYDKHIKNYLTGEQIYLSQIMLGSYDRAKAVFELLE